MTLHTDILILGSGAAGLGVALSLADHYHITLISKSCLMAGSSPRAQGGIAAVMQQDADALEAHVQDTLKTGCGLCDEAVVRATVEQARSAILWLIHHGVQFTQHPNSSQFHLTQEGGHTQRRILHSADRTGSSVITTLAEAAQNHPNITVLTEHTAIDLIKDDNTVIGATFVGNHSRQHMHILAKATVLATGGASSCYRHTSNADHATGDGMAMAARAGATLRAMAFNQFHPTVFYNPGSTPFLISEAVRGEGGILRRIDGTAFMAQYDERAELAPRDIVARAIDHELKQHKQPHVLLDITHKSAGDIKSLFPTIYAHCLSRGIDITTDPIPVVPAAHYTCGGIATDLNAKTGIKQLYAVGEVAHTGLHGANRLASNSLLECLVFAANCASDLLHTLPNTPLKKSHPPSPSNKPLPDDNMINKIIETLRNTLWEEVGIIRTHEGLAHARTLLANMRTSIDALSTRFASTPALIECCNMHLVATAIVEDAINQPHSVGLHTIQPAP